MIYELRLYAVTPGRMQDTHARFEHALPALFERHSLNCVGRWTALTGPDLPVFVYMLAYTDLAQREAQWKTFYADPEWARVRAETNAGEEMVDHYQLMFLKPLKSLLRVNADEPQHVSGIHELILQQVALGQPNATREYLAASYLPALRAAGAGVMTVCDMVTGRDLPQLVLLLTWADASSRDRGWKRVLSDEALRALVKAQRKELGKPLLGHSISYLLEPAAYALPEPYLGAQG
ncbi:MAG: NIPSNAP family protein [Panacagrimonas sp.]